MVYNWEGKEDDCYRLYIEENKSVEQVAQYMKEHYNFDPRFAIPCSKSPSATS